MTATLEHAGAMEQAEGVGAGADEDRWRAVAARDAAWDGRLVYAVTSTGVYCRPSCPSRRPLRHNVRLFDAPADAERAGFRACRRCRPHEVPHAEACVARAQALLDARIADGSDARLTLRMLADAVGMSAHHLQRVFTRQVGLSPAEYLRRGRSERLKAALREGGTVSRATFDAGFASASRAYEAAGVHLGMSPTTYRQGGRGVRVRFRVVPSSLGYVLVAATVRGVCRVALGDDAGALEAELAAEFPQAELARAEPAAATGDDAEFGAWVDAVVAHLDATTTPGEVPLDVRATAFQRRVWRALRAIPRGQTRSYTEIAATVGAPRAVRAVARACATNPVALVVPCHRVVRADGALAGYRWGVERKRALLAREREA